MAIIRFLCDLETYRESSVNMTLRAKAVTGTTISHFFTKMQAVID